jgi:hypothetical protein
MSLCDPDNMPHAIDIHHVEYIQDDFGGDAIDPDSGPFATDEPCWIQTPSASTIKIFAARNQNVTHTIYVTRNPDAFGVRLDDQITVKSGPYAGVILSILAWREATVGMGLLWAMQCSTDLEIRT